MGLGGASQDLSAARTPLRLEAFDRFIFQGGRERGQFSFELVAFLVWVPAKRSTNHTKRRACLVSCDSLIVLRQWKKSAKLNQDTTVKAAPFWISQSGLLHSRSRLVFYLRFTINDSETKVS